MILRRKVGLRKRQNIKTSLKHTRLLKYTRTCIFTQENVFITKHFLFCTSHMHFRIAHLMS